MDLSEALEVDPLRYSDKAIKSVRSQVTNITDHLQHPMELLDFVELVMDHIISTNDSATRYELTEEDNSFIQRYQREKYETWAWNFGSSPQYSFRRDGRIARGVVEIKFNVEKGCILDLQIAGIS